MKILRYITAFLPLIVEVAERAEQIIDRLKEQDNRTSSAANAQINNARVITNSR